MDLSSINRLNNNHVAFQGRKAVKDNKGIQKETFFLPHIELNKDKGEKIGIEFVLLGRDSDGVNYVLKDGSKPIRYKSGSDDFKKFEDGESTSVSLDLSGLKNHGEYAYRFIVYDKNDNKIKKAFADSVGAKIKGKVSYDGKETSDGEFTIVSTRQGLPVLKGGMEHIFTDSYNVKNPAQIFKRNHFNKAGGTINGITAKIQDGELESQRYIMTTPLIGGGHVSSHMYHPANHFQISAGTGTKEDFLNLQKACFDNGKGYVLDGAFTSQGYEGIQLNHALKWKDSPFKYWFKNPSDNGYALGVLSDDPDVRKHTGIKIVNPKHDPNYRYNPDMPTYIQFYDDRLASPAQIDDKSKLITEYENKVNVDDPYEITTWHDATLPNYFEINPDLKVTMGETPKSLDEWEKAGKLNDILNIAGTQVSFTTHELTGGTTGWDGNIDLVKMNLSNQTENNKNLVKGSKQAKNYMYNIAKYWTGETKDALIMHVADNIKGKTKADRTNYFKTIEKTYSLNDENNNDGSYLSNLYDAMYLDSNRDLHESKNPPIPYYSLGVGDRKGKANDIIQETILEFPLESLDFSPELLSVLSTPYITPRPTTESNPAASRTQILKDATKDGADSEFSKTMKEVYTEIIPSMIRDILHDSQGEGTKPPRLFKHNANNIDELTQYGKYFLELSRDDIMQFLFSAALFGENGIPKDEDGNITFDFASLNNFQDDTPEGNGKFLNLKKLGINASTPQKEAEEVAKKIRKGLLELKKDKDTMIEFKNVLKNKYLEGRTVDDYKIAEAIVDKSGAGLNWRFDAAKDVADIDEIKEGKVPSAEKFWDDVIDFWKPFVKNIRDINPSSYIIAEVTDTWGIKSYDYGKYGKTSSDKKPDAAEKFFYEETGATSGSNYSTFFGAYPKLFGKNIEQGAVENYRSITSFLNSAKGFCAQDADEFGHYSSEFAIGSHVFLDNHDKPRAAHLMAVDAALFWEDLKNDEDKEKAKAVLDVDNYSDKMNSKAVAVAEKYLEYFDKELDNISEGGKAKDGDKEILHEAIRHLARGSKYIDMNDKSLNYKRADSFGCTPYEITIPHVLEIAERKGLKLDDNKRKELENAVFADMVAPYESKMAAIYEMMTGTVGIPTIFAGDEFAQTGCETRSKNWALGCRNLVRHDWTQPFKKDENGNIVTNEKGEPVNNPEYKEHVAKFNNRVKQTGLLGTSSKAMSALADGTPIVIPAKENKEPFDVEKHLNGVSKDDFIEGIKKVAKDEMGWHGGKLQSTAKYLGFLECVKEKEGEKDKEGCVAVDIDKIAAELNNMEKDDIIKNYLTIAKNNSDKGNVKWFSGYIKPLSPDKVLTETGAVVKYNDKGSVVVSMMTNAFMPENTDVSGLSKDPVTSAPLVSSVKLVDENGNKIAKEGAVFVRKAYDEEKGKYVDAGEYTYTKEGTLEAKNGSKAMLDSTVTYFYKKSADNFRTY